MAHYAFLDTNNIVTGVIVGKNEGDEGIDWEQRYSEIRGQTCKRTSFNTRAGTHVLGGTPFRKNYAAKGYTYDNIRDAFIPPKPHPSWKFNEEGCIWEPPTALPEDEGSGDPRKEYAWDEITTSWVDVTPE